MGADYEYLIVTDSIMAPAFQRLANWKTAKGVRAKVLTISEIDSTYSGATSQIRIKQAIKDYHAGQYNGLEYVLLGGDINIIPTQGTYIKYSSYTEYNAPTDLFYSCLGSLNWDTNGNGIAGELSDSIQLAPDVIVSRIPITDIESANVFVERIINYETHQVMNNWQNNILTCGKKLTNYSIVGNDTISDSQIRGDYLYNNYIQPYWNGERVRFYDTATDFEGGKDYDLTSQHLQIELEKGYTIVYVNTHGSTITWQMEKEKGYPSYYHSSAMALSESKPMVIITDACNTNAFDYNSICLSEAFIRNPNANIISYIGSSRNGWGSSSPKYSQQLFKNILRSDSKQLGSAFYAMKSYFIGNCNGNNATRWLLFSINMLGDPEMSIYLEKPKYLNMAQISCANDSLIIQTGVDSCKICIMSLHDFGESHYHVEENASTYSCPNLGTDLSICVTKPGYIPCLTLVCDSGYIQDKTLNGDVRIIARQTFIGSDVCTNMENGPVTIQNGKLSIHSPKGVTIKNDFEIALGSELDVNTN